MNAKNTIRCLLTFPIEESILLVGNHGIGKSQVVKQVAHKLDVPCIDFRLSQNDVGDLKGMPFHVNGRTVFAPPEFMPITKKDAEELKDFLNLTEDIKMGRYGDSGILFLDEINRATREVQQAAFELVLDRRMNLRALPDGWRVVAAVNGEDDIYTVNSLDPAFLSRFFKIDFEPSYEEWMDWAHETGIHASITEFLRRYPDLLDPTKELMEEASREGVKKVHDRRAWDKFSRTINKLLKDHEEGKCGDPLGKDPENLNFLTLTAHGYVGVLAGSKFRSFIETDYKALDADAILNRFDKTIESQLKDIVKKGRIPEIGAYNEALIDYIKRNKVKTLKDKQKKNLTSYLGLLPKETVSDFWQLFNHEYTDVSTDWYNSDPKNADIILKALVNPDVKKKEAKKA